MHRTTFPVLLVAVAIAGVIGPRALAAEKADAGDDGEWPMPAKDYASTRFSELDQINAEERQGPQGRLDLLDGRRSRPGGGADRRRRRRCTW